MKATKTDVTGLQRNTIICSIWSKHNKSWIRTLKNVNGMDKLVVERSLPGSSDNLDYCSL